LIIENLDNIIANYFNNISIPIIVLNLDDIIKKIEPVFLEVFDDETLVIDEDTSAADIEAWDSLTHIRLIISIETAFDLQFSTLDIAELQNVGDLAHLILSKS